MYTQFGTRMQIQHQTKFLFSGVTDIINQIQRFVPASIILNGDLLDL